MIFNRTLSPAEVLMLYRRVNQTPVPVITSLKLTGSNAVISFTTVTNALYEVDYRNDLTTGAWLTLTNGVPGTSGILSITNGGAASQSRRFYRVVAHF
jgi:hypothetical protein